MAGFITRGQPAAVRQVSAMIAAGLPHGLLLVGPRSVGKTTLALDIAAAQLCLAPDVADRPCRACRGCRLVAAGNHPDVHRVAPDGAGSTIGIDVVRALISDLALLPAEGGARVALVEAAHRMTEDGQNALLKTLEEPPAGVTLILCAEDEDRLLPTIHSRVARVRLGTVAVREIEGLLAERGETDAPTASRLARIAEGRPGLAVAYARSSDAATIRGELARSLLDLVDEPTALRLVRIRELLARASDLARALAPIPVEAEGAGTTGRGGRRRGRGPRGAAMSAVSAVEVPPTPFVAPGASATDGGSSGATEEGGEEPATASKSSPAERRRGAAMLLEVWRDTGRDLALVELGDLGRLHDPDLAEELTATAGRLHPRSIGAFLVRLDRAGQLLDANANPELLADVLVLAWPRATRAA